jgi:hypothetical protein
MIDIVNIGTNCLSLMLFNAIIYFLFTTKTTRYHNYRQTRVLFFHAHRASYLEVAKSGSALFLALLNKFFGHVDASDKLIGTKYFNRRMMTITYWISFTYISTSIIYLDYISNSKFVYATLLEGILSNYVPKTFYSVFDNNNWMHIILVIWLLLPLFNCDSFNGSC